MKSIGTRGNAPDQFNTPHTIASDAKGNIYVGDRGNSRIQVFDPDLNPVRIISNVRAPWAICITPPNPQGQQFLYSADAGGKIYKEDLDGHLLGWFGTTGKKVGQFYWVHEMHCVSENELYTGEAQNWRVQHITLKPAPTNFWLKLHGRGYSRCGSTSRPRSAHAGRADGDPQHRPHRAPAKQRCFCACLPQSCHCGLRRVSSSLLRGALRHRRSARDRSGHPRKATERPALRTSAVFRG